MWIALKNYGEHDKKKLVNVCVCMQNICHAGNEKNGLKTALDAIKFASYISYTPGTSHPRQVYITTCVVQRE